MDPPASTKAAPPNLTDRAGFTLIEVVIVMVILVFISLGIYQMTTETYKLRDELAAEGEFYNSIRMAMDVVQRDVAAMFSPVMSQPNPPPSPNPQNPSTLPPPPNAQDMQAIMDSDAGKTSSYWLGATDKSALRLSRFVGTDSKMSFVTAAHVRIYKDLPESDFAKVSYELARDEQGGTTSDAMVLVKTENPDVFDDDDRRAERYAHRYLLLHGIKKLRFRYWRKDKDNGLGRWETSWDTDKEDYKNKYPDIVEVTLEKNEGTKLSFTGTFKFRPEVALREINPSF